MKGAVAAGHPLTAQAGARALAEGGNAVDACVAAAFAAAVTESPLTGPGAGGFMLVHRARDRSTRLADFFVAAPGPRPQAPSRRARCRSSTSASATATTTQPFLIGPASCAVPGRGRRARGRAPRATAGCRGASCSQPAIELARDGRRADAAAGAHARAPRPDPPLDAPRAGAIYSDADGDAPRRRRHAAPARPRRHARGDRAPRRAPRSTAASGRARSSRRCATAAAS